MKHAGDVLSFRLDRNGAHVRPGTASQTTPGLAASFFIASRKAPGRRAGSAGWYAQAPPARKTEVRLSAGLEAHQNGLQVAEEAQQLVALKLTASNGRPDLIDRINLENRLISIKPNVRTSIISNLGSLRAGAYQAPTGEREPSTPSLCLSSARPSLSSD